jgi:hypothetical protein
VIKGHIYIVVIYTTGSKTHEWNFIFWFCILLRILQQYSM